MEKFYDIVQAFKENSLKRMYCDSYDEHREDNVKCLLLEQDSEHTYENFESFFLSSGNDFSITSFDSLTEHLLDGYWTFTHFSDSPIGERVMNEALRYYVTPNLFCPSYARYLHSQSEVKYFYNQKDNLVILEKGLYRPATEFFNATPGCDIRTFCGIFAVDKLPDNIKKLGYDEICEFIENNYSFWMSYHGNYSRSVELSINTKKIKRHEFMQKLKDACKKENKELTLII